MSDRQAYVICMYNKKGPAIWKGNLSNADFSDRFKEKLVSYSSDPNNRTAEMAFYGELTKQLDAVKPPVGGNETNNIIRARNVITKARQIREKDAEEFNDPRIFTQDDFVDKPSVGTPTGTSPPVLLTVEKFLTNNLKMKPNPSKYNPETKKWEACYIFEYADKVTPNPGQGPTTGFLVHLTVFLNDQQKSQPARKNNAAFGKLHNTVEMQDHNDVNGENNPRCWVKSNTRTGAGKRLSEEAKKQIEIWANEVKASINAL